MLYCVQVLDREPHPEPVPVLHEPVHWQHHAEPESVQCWSGFLLLHRAGVWSAPQPVCRHRFSHHHCCARLHGSTNLCSGTIHRVYTRVRKQWHNSYDNLMYRLRRCWRNCVPSNRLFPGIGLFPSRRAHWQCLPCECCCSQA